MALNFFDTTEVDAFAQWTVAELGKRMPPATLERNDRKAVERMGKMNEAVSEKARALAPSLNFYKRARLGSRIKWGMKQAGYPAEFTETFTYELLTVLTVAARAPNVKKQ